jgi:hypothetical protein
VVIPPEWGAGALALQCSVMVSVTMTGTVVVDTGEGSLVLGNFREKFLAWPGATGRSVLWLGTMERCDLWLGTMEMSELWLGTMVTLSEPSIWALCWSRGRLEVGSIIVLEVVLMDMLNSVAMSEVLRWVRGVLL